MRGYFLDFSHGSSRASARLQDDPAKVGLKRGFLKKVDLEGHVAVEGPCRLDAERAGEQGLNPQQVSLAHSLVLLQGVLRVVGSATLATPLSSHQRLPPIHFHFLKPAT